MRPDVPDRKIFLKRWVRTSLLVALVVVGFLAVVGLRFSRPASGLELAPAGPVEPNVESSDGVDSVASEPAPGMEKNHLKQRERLELSHSAETQQRKEESVARKDESLVGEDVTDDLLSKEEKSVVGNPAFSLSSPLQRRHNERQEEVVNMFKHAWMGYRKYAWGQDELLPLSKSGTSPYGMGLTIIDSLDTMWLMGLTEEFQKARDWVANSLNIVENHRRVSVFETNIRVVGGLLAAYHLSNDHIFLQKAVEVADRLLPAFSTPTGIPYSLVILNHQPHKISSVACVAEMGSLQLEFRDLSHSTGDSKYQKAVDKALDVFQAHLGNDIAPQEVYINTGRPKHTLFTVGGQTDSYYEYLLKQWIQSGKTEDKFKGWYSNSASAILTKFVKFSQPHHMAFLARLNSPDGGGVDTRMDHLACFVPGMLALGYLHGFPASHLNTAKDLAHTCYELYHQSPCGLSPDEVVFNTDKLFNSSFQSTVSENFQRPETVESLFVLYRVTKDPRYRDWGWEILQAFKRHSRVDSGGFSTLRNVNSPKPSHSNRMESFFLAETLKYLFLLFTDDSDILPLDKWVFNTEAHPLPVWAS